MQVKEQIVYQTPAGGVNSVALVGAKFVVFSNHLAKNVLECTPTLAVEPFFHSNRFLDVRHDVDGTWNLLLRCYPLGFLVGNSCKPNTTYEHLLLPKVKTQRLKCLQI